MKEKLSGFTGKFKEFWAGASKGTRKLLISGLGAVLVVSLVVVLLLNRNDTITLYDNLTVSENASVIAELQEMGVEAKLDGGKVLIPKSAENTVRMQLATKGYPDSGFGYETYQMGMGLTSTQQQQEQVRIFQMQERLEATIKTFPEVKDAHVTISVPDSNNFVWASDVQKPSASVKIEKAAGRTLTPEQVRGILNIVKTSVSGLEEENIAIVDEAGDLKSTLDLGGDTSSMKLQLTEQVNSSVERKLTELLHKIYGDGVSVAVSSVLDTDEKVTETVSYNPLNPENPTDNPINYSEESYDRSGSAAVAQGVPGATNNTDVPQYNALDGDDANNGYAAGQTIIDYLVSSEHEQVRKEGLVIADMTVAVLIDANELPDGQRDQVIDLVANAAGVRRDKVSVQSIRFANSGAQAEAGDGTGVASPPNYVLMAIIAAGSIALIVIVVMVVLSVRKSRRKKREEAEQEALEQQTLAEMLAAQEENFEPIQLGETQEQKLKAQIRDLASSDPEIVAQLLKTWLITT